MQGKAIMDTLPLTLRESLASTFLSAGLFSKAWIDLGVNGGL